MSYTSSDLNNIKSAILSLATGERVVTVSIGGKRIEYAQAQLGDLRSLASEIQAELKSKAGKHNVILIKTGKGL